MRKIHLFVLIAMLLVGITFSVIQIIKANPDAPNPGHSASEIECDTNLCIATTTGRVGIGSTSPGAKLQINPSNSTEGLRIVTASDYSPLNIRNATNDIFRIDQTGTLAAGAVPWARLSAFPANCPSGQFVVGVGGTLTCAAVSGLPSGTSGQTLRHDGTNWLANSVFYNNGTDIGIGTTGPQAKLQINPGSGKEGLRIVTASDYSPLNIRNNANSADIFRVDQTGSLAVGTVPWARLSSFPSACTSGQYVTAVGGTLTCAAVSGLPSGTSGQTLRYGSSGWEASSVLLNNGTGVTIGGSGKLTVTTIDPVYNIQGAKYSTYMSGMLGVKEETTGVVQLTKGEYVIDFDELEKGSDLWIFYRITDFGENWNKLSVLLSAEGPGGVWYKKEPQNNVLFIYSPTAGSVSFRLTAPRFDWQEWLSVSEDGTVAGLTVDEIINNRYSQKAGD